MNDVPMIAINTKLIRDYETQCQHNQNQIKLLVIRIKFIHATQVQSKDTNILLVYMLCDTQTAQSHKLMFGHSTKKN